MKRCEGGDFVVRHGEWIEIFDENGGFITSFRATSDMCEKVLTRYLVFQANMDPATVYKLKRRSK